MRKEMNFLLLSLLLSITNLTLLKFIKHMLTMTQPWNQLNYYLNKNEKNMFYYK